MANAECPFCGVKITMIGDRDYGVHPINTDCPIDGCERPMAQWQMRPPKKEQPMPAVTSEVEWLRALVVKLVVEDPNRNYEETTAFYPANFATSERTEVKGK